MLNFKENALKDKSGNALAPVIEDMRGRADALLICNFGSDDPSAPISAHLLEKHSDLIAGGLTALAEAAECKSVLLYAAELDVSVVKAALEAAGLSVETAAGQASPVLREATALYTLLNKGLIRTAIAELEYTRSFPSEGYQNRPTLTVDAETAFVAGQLAAGEAQTKHIAVIRGETEIREVPLGTPLAEVLGEDAACATPVLLGGVCGSYLCADDVQAITLQHVWENDVAEVLSKDTCVVARTAKFYNQIFELTCAKCVMCREGSWQLSAIFGDMTAGKAAEDDYALIGELTKMVGQGAICEFGKKMVRAADTALKNHKEAFDTHIVSKTCPQGQCGGMMKYLIDPALCT